MPVVVPSLEELLPEPPHAVSSGSPPLTAAAATAVEARKLLRLGAEVEFGVIASTLQWRTRTTRGGGPPIGSCV
ncbi:hypothetical protein GCM10028832_27880 [Streptomyces sparsus]